MLGPDIRPSGSIRSGHRFGTRAPPWGRALWQQVLRLIQMGLLVGGDVSGRTWQEPISDSCFFWAVGDVDD
jgi:hypothetical protein